MEREASVRNLDIRLLSTARDAPHRDGARERRSVLHRAAAALREASPRLAFEVFQRALPRSAARASIRFASTTARLWRPRPMIPASSRATTSKR